LTAVEEDRLWCVDLPFKIKLCGAELRGVWDGRIVSDAALTTRINVARNAIGDSGEDQRLIKTLPRKGFRFVGAVQEEHLFTHLGADAHDRLWHTFSVRCAAVIPSGYRVTFVVPVTRLAGELLTRSRSSSR
jgi:hypothetical protein